MTVDRGFHAAQLVRRDDVGGGLSRVLVRVEPHLAATHRTAGQYVEMRIAGETGFFVLASEPGDAPWTLIMRPGGGASDVVLAAPQGSPLELTGALGAGFPVDAVAGRPLVLALNGTGVAAAPPLVARRLRDGDARSTALFLGIRSREELPLEAELLGWQAQGVRIVVCLSQATPGVSSAPPVADRVPPGGAGSLEYSNGYVQDVLGAHLVAESLSGGRIFAVGSTAMLEALTERAPSLGLRPEDVVTNY